MTQTVEERRIVVGVDGSEPSKQALRWAMDQARLTRSTVDAVRAWSYPSAYGWSVEVDADELIKINGEVLHETLAEVAGDLPPVPVRPRVVEGHPAQVLINEAHGAQLLVLGSRGHGGFVGALLGSVSQHCVHHAPCPVVIVRGAPG